MKRAYAAGRYVCWDAGSVVSLPLAVDHDSGLMLNRGCKLPGSPRDVISGFAELKDVPVIEASRRLVAEDLIAKLEVTDGNEKLAAVIARSDVLVSNPTFDGFVVSDDGGGRIVISALSHQTPRTDVSADKRLLCAVVIPECEQAVSQFVGPNASGIAIASNRESLSQDRVFHRKQQGLGRAANGNTGSQRLACNQALGAFEHPPHESGNARGERVDIRILCYAASQRRSGESSFNDSTAGISDQVCLVCLFGTGKRRGDR